jgi:hypothetical protein
MELYTCSLLLLLFLLYRSCARVAVRNVGGRCFCKNAAPPERPRWPSSAPCGPVVRSRVFSQAGPGVQGARPRQGPHALLEAPWARVMSGARTTCRLIARGKSASLLLDHSMAPTISESEKEVIEYTRPLDRPGLSTSIPRPFLNPQPRALPSSSLPTFPSCGQEKQKKRRGRPSLLCST